MIATFAEKIEIRFWDMILPLLTHSSFVRKIVRNVVVFYHNEQLVKRAAFVAMVACAGFAFGILIFTIKNIIG